MCFLLLTLNCVNVLRDYGTIIAQFKKIENKMKHVTISSRWLNLIEFFQIRSLKSPNGMYPKDKNNCTKSLNSYEILTDRRIQSRMNQVSRVLWGCFLLSLGIKTLH